MLIVASVLFAMRGFVGGSRISVQHPDLVTMWVPTFGYLGRALAHFHIPDWNPYALAGMPFAADPQSGWTYLPAMLLFTVLSPTTALNTLLLLNPLLVGLGAYAFLRSEGYPRPAATVAGLLAALPFATSRLALSTPLIGALGWTSVMLAAASRAMRSRRPSRVVLWGLATAFCWGQVANAHLSNGLVIASGLLAIYLLAVAVGERSASPGWAAWRRGLVLVAALPIVNAAVLLPRLGYLGRSSISLGYSTLEALSQKLTGTPTVSLVGLTTTEAGVSLASIPPPYIGLLGFALAAAWWWSGIRGRPLAIGLAATASVLTLVGSQSFSEGIQPLVGSGTLGGFLTHEPFRFLLGEVLALALLAGIGAAALASRAERSGPVALAFLLPGAVLWALSALGQGERFHASPLGLLAVVAVAGAAVALPRRLGWILAGLVAYDLLVAGAIGAGPAFAEDPFPMRQPEIPAQTLAPSQLERAVAEAGRSGERYAPWAQWGDGGAGPFAYQFPESWAIGGNGRGMLYGGMDVGGYNPSQPTRTWLAMRTLDPAAKRYNQSFIEDPSPALIDLLNLRWLIAQEPPAWAESDAVATDGPFSLFRVPGTTGLATFPASVERAADRDAAFAAISAAGFDPASSGVWEGDGSLGVDAGAGTATATWERDDRLVLDVEATRGGLLLVRLPWDPGWRATAEGRALDVVPADGFVSGVVVPAGTYRLVLDYEDASIARGLLVSLVACLGAFALAILWRRKPEFEVTPRFLDAVPVSSARQARGRRPRDRRRR